MGRTMLAGCPEPWRESVRQAVKGRSESWNGDTAPGELPLLPRTVLGLL